MVCPSLEEVGGNSQAWCVIGKGCGIHHTYWIKDGMTPKFEVEKWCEWRYSSPGWRRLGEEQVKDGVTKI